MKIKKINEIIYNVKKRTVLKKRRIFTKILIWKRRRETNSNSNDNAKALFAKAIEYYDSMNKQEAACYYKMAANNGHALFEEYLRIYAGIMWYNSNEQRRSSSLLWNGNWKDDVGAIYNFALLLEEWTEIPTNKEKSSSLLRNGSR